MNKSIILISILILCGCHKFENCDYLKSVEANKKEIDSLFTQINPLILKLKKKKIHEYNYEVYRFWHFRALSGNHYMIEFRNEGRDKSIIYEKYSYEQDSIFIKEKRSVNLTKMDWRKIENLIDKYNFWQTEVFIDRLVTDGFVFILEGSKTCRNRFVSKAVWRNTPKETDDIRILCESLINFQEDLNKN